MNIPFLKNIDTEKLFALSVSVYVATICFLPSNAEIFGFIALIVSAVIVFQAKQLRFFNDSALYSLIAFGFFSTIVNALGSGEISRTAVIYGWIIPFLVGKAFGQFRANTLWTDLFIASVVLAGIVLIAQALLLMGVHEFLGQELNLNRMTLTFRNSSRTALFVATGALIALAYAASAQSRGKIFLAYASCLAMISALVITGSRATLAAFLVCSGVLLILRKKFLNILAITAVILCLIPLAGEVTRFNLDIDETLTSQSAVERFTVWYAALEIFKEHPVIGSGFRTFKAESTPYVAQYRENHPKLYDYENLNDAHNIILHLLSESGLIGTSLYFFFFIVIIKHLWENIKNRSSTLLISCIILYLIHAQLHVNISSINVSSLVFLLAGISKGLTSIKD